MGKNTDVLSKNSFKKFQGKRIIFVFKKNHAPWKFEIYPKIGKKRKKIGEKCKNDEISFLFETHPYFASFSPKK